MDKRQEPIFWMEDICPHCFYTNGIIYKPDLIDEEVITECRRENCKKKYSTAMIIDETIKLEKLLEIAEEKDRIIGRLNRINQILGCKL